MIGRIPASIWLILAQGMSSCGNLLLAILVGRSSSVSEFAAFALLTPAWIVAQRVTRVYLLIPRQIELSSSSTTPGLGAEPTNSPVAASILLVIPFALLCAGIGAAIGSPFASWAISLAIVLPGLTWYDAVRNEYLAERRTHLVAVGDGAWLALQVALSATVYAIDAPSVWYQFAWGISASCAAAAMAARRAWRIPAAWRAAVTRIVHSRHLAADSITDVLNSVLIVQATPYLIAGLASLTIAGEIRGALTLLGPINVVLMGLLPTLQISSASNSTNPDRLRKSIVRFCAVTSALTIAYCLVPIALPAQLGRELLGPTWAGASAQLVALSAQALLRTPVMAAITVMRSINRRDLLIWLRVLEALAMTGGSALGALTAFRTGASWGMAAGTAAAALAACSLVYICLIDLVRQHADTPKIVSDIA